MYDEPTETVSNSAPYLLRVNGVAAARRLTLTFVPRYRIISGF